MRSLNPHLLGLLGTSTLFRKVPADQLADVLEQARWRQVKNKSFFFIEEDPAEYTYVLSDGKVKLTQSGPDGQRVLLGYLVPGRTFGIISALKKMTYPVTAEAVGDCQALFWDQDTIRRLMDRYPRIALNALHIMSGQIRLFQNRVRELSTQRVEQRIARTILRLTEQTSRPMRDGLLIDLPLSREDLAQMTGSTLYTVSRVLTGWEKKGLVRCKRQEIIVKELHALHAIAENSPVVPPTTSQTDKLCDV